MPHAHVALGLAIPPRGGSRPRGCPRHPGSRTPVRARRCRWLVARWPFALAANREGRSRSSMLQALSPPRLPRLPRSGTGAPSAPADAGAGSLRRRPGEASRGAAAPRLSAVAAVSTARSPGHVLLACRLRGRARVRFPPEGVARQEGTRGSRRGASGEGLTAAALRAVGPTALPTRPHRAVVCPPLVVAARRTPPHPATPRHTPPHPAVPCPHRGNWG